MAFSNAHAGVFMSIPEGITKTWTRKVHRADRILESIPNAVRHRHSPLKGITLSIEFENIKEFTSDSYSGLDDHNDDAIDLWKEYRETWAKLEQGVESAVTSLISKIRTELEETKNSNSMSYDAPRADKTVVHRAKKIEPVRRTQSLPLAHQQPIYVQPESVVSFADDKTVIPDDSASSVHSSMLRQIVAEEITRAATRTTNRLSEAQGDKKKKKKQKSKERKSSNPSDRAMSLLSYTART